jgi:ribose-phosphate pyrophosphokinase
MKILNLVYPEQSDIKYKISSFPDGQHQVDINLETVDFDTTMDYIPYIDWSKEIQIKSRLNNWIDLEIIACTVASLKEIGYKRIHLYIPYVVGARSDRKFTNGGNNYLKHVICPALNHLGLESITVIDPHSDCLEMGINNYKKIDNYNLITWSLGKIYNTPPHLARDMNNFIFASPDAGASKKIFKVAEKLGYKEDIIICGKDRDENGKLTRTIVPILPYTEKDIIIIDDICDGGRTFINIVEEIRKTEGFNGKIYLITTHGIFSAGFKELSKYFDGIYCTNSYQDKEDIEIKFGLTATIKYVINNVHFLNIFEND